MNTRTMYTPFVYKWTHLPTLMWYVGSRTSKQCHPSDGYICSSKLVKPLILKNPDEWNREIVATGSAEEMRALEVEILQLFDARNDPRSFNMTNGDGQINMRKANTAWADRVRGKKLADFNHNASALAESKRGKKLADFNPGAAACIESRRGKKLAEYAPKAAERNETNRGKKLADFNPSAAMYAESKRGKKLADFNPNAAAEIESRRKPIIGTCLASGARTHFESLSQAAQSIGAESTTIASVLKGRQKSCKGYTFQYAN